jgi:hypothetical protein
MSDEFMVIADLSEEAIIGVNTIRKWRIKLDFEHDCVIVDRKAARLMLKELQSAFTPPSPAVSVP